MDPKTAQAAMAFMNRVQLQGSEVPTWTVVMKALHTCSTSPVMPTLPIKKEAEADAEDR